MTHKTISLIKSIVRIIGLISLFKNIEIGIILLIIAEVIGIIEEL